MNLAIPAKDYAPAYLRAAIAGAVAAAVGMALGACNVRWSVAVGQSPWTRLAWPYVIYAMASILWLCVLGACVHAAIFRAARHLGLLCIAVVAGGLPMLAVAWIISDPPRAPTSVAIVILSVGAIAVVVAFSCRLPALAALAIRAALLLWIFILPCLGLLDIGISSGGMPIWGRISPLYLLARSLGGAGH